MINVIPTNKQFYDRSIYTKHYTIPSDINAELVAFYSNFQVDMLFCNEISFYILFLNNYGALLSKMRFYCSVVILMFYIILFYYVRSKYDPSDA